MRTPARTPAVGGHDRLMQEAQNLINLQTGKTPLLGGENPDLHPSGGLRGWSRWASGCVWEEAGGLGIQGKAELRS